MVENGLSGDCEMVCVGDWENGSESDLGMEWIAPYSLPVSITQFVEQDYHLF